MSNRTPVWVILLSALFSCAHAAIAHRILEEDHDHDHDHDHDEDHDEDHDDEESEKWGEVIGTTLLVNVVTLIGVLTIFPFGAFFFDTSEEKQHYAFIGVPAFAVGALVATAVFLIIPEALHLIADDGWDENEVNLFFGLAFLFGFLLPTMLNMFFPKPELSTEEVAAMVSGRAVEVEEEEADESSSATPVKPQESKSKVDLQLCSSILLGDAAHNFVDGMFIGTAFKLCDSSQAYAIVAATVYHELAQELADFFLLTRQANLSSAKALMVNFLSGLSVVLGGIIITGIDISTGWTGAILSMSAGVYLHIAMTECMPRVHEYSKMATHYLFAMTMIAFGVIPIGLVLIVHEHCEGGHDGHDH